MKWNLLILLSLIVLSANAVSINQTEDGTFGVEITKFALSNLELEFSLEDFRAETTLQDGKEFQEISLGEEGFTVEKGMPELPTISRLIRIPDMGNVDVVVENVTSERLPNYNIIPQQRMLFSNELVNESFEQNRSFYSGEETFPQEKVYAGDPAIMRNVRLIKITFCPFQYDAGTNELIVNSEIKVSIQTSGKGGKNTITKQRKPSRIFNKIINSAVLNPITTREEFQKPALLIIYPNTTSLDDILESFVEWKHRKGFVVNMVSTSVTGTSSSSIKNYIEDQYENSENPPEYVCFIGDTSGQYIIPTWTESWSGYYGSGDHTYTTIAGDDILADIIPGRISISSAMELQTVVSKVFSYEKTPYMGDVNWYEKALLVGDPGSSGISCITTSQYISETISRNYPNFNNTEVYSGSWVNQISNGINGGVSYFNYRGYYGMSGWQNSNISSLNNGPMLPFAVFLTCDTGTFNFGTSRSEQFLRVGTPSIPKGAIAAIGTATSHTHTTFNNCISMGIFYGIFHEKLPDPGSALVRGKLALYNNFPDNPSNSVNIFSHWNTLMADPTVQLWKSVPEVMTVEMTSSVALETTNLTVTVTDNNGEALENAWVTLLKGDDEIFESAYTNSDGQAVLNAYSVVAGDAKLTLTKDGFIPILEDVVFESADVNLQVESFSIDDDNDGASSGNSDGYVNVLENIQLDFEIKNSGSTDSGIINIVLSSTSELIDIVNNSSLVSNIFAGSIANNNELVVQASAACLGGEEIVLNIEFNTDTADWSDQIILFVENSNLSPQSLDFVDGGIINPSESKELSIDLINLGSVDAQNVDVILSCETELISIGDNNANYGDISAGNSISNDSDTFEIAASNQALPGSEYTLNLFITADNGFSQTQSIVLVVGTKDEGDPVGPDSYGYYMYDNFDTDYAIAPIYSWMDISSIGNNLNLNDSGETGDSETIDLPFNLFYYGFSYDQLTICSNGWVSPGETDMISFMNWHIPGAMGPTPMIAPFWDDLKTDDDDDVYTYYDSASHRFIVQWANMKNSYNSANENFQLIIRDRDVYTTPTGDNELVFQYEEINNVDQGSYGGSIVHHGEYATVGIEDHTSDVGLEYTYSNNYAAGAHELVDNMAILITTNGGDVSDPPIVGFSNEDYDLVIPPGGVSQRVLNISNSGEANLYYTISKNYDESRNAKISEMSLRDSGGPDNYGYYWEDSNEANGPEYNWREISEIATSISYTNNDATDQIFDIGFNLNFYGEDYQQFRVNPNGWIGFADDNDEWLNIAIPDNTAPEAAIMPFWDDLRPEMAGEGEGTVYFYSTIDSLVVTFDNVQHYPGQNDGNYTFQTIIYPDGKILMQYKNLSGDFNRCTVGLQNHDASDATNVVYNSNYLEENLAIAFDRVIEWVSLDNYNGVVPSGESRNVTINVSAADLLLGQYICRLEINSNDPENSSVEIPITLTVAGDVPIISVDQQVVDFGNVEINQEASATINISNLGSETLVVNDITVDSDDYSLSYEPGSINDDETIPVEISFIPQSAGTSNAILTIYSNDVYNETFNIALTGNGATPEIYISTENLEFPITMVGEAEMLSFNISNSGSSTLVVDISTLADYISLDSSEFSIEPTENATCEVTFTPDTEGDFATILAISSNDLDNPELEITITGSADLPQNSDDLVPLITTVEQNYPNPFNPSGAGRGLTTSIDFSIAENNSNVKICIYNVKGQLITTLVDAEYSTGRYKVVWNGTDNANKSVSSGLYYYKFETDEQKTIKKMLLIK